MGQASCLPLCRDLSFPGSSLGTHHPEAPASSSTNSNSTNDWLTDLREISTILADCCRRVDPQSTDKALEESEEDFT